VRRNPISGAFLSANPSYKPHAIGDKEFSAAVGFYLGCVPREQGLVNPACPVNGCGAEVYPAPAHDLACKRTKGPRSIRHQDLKFALHRLFSKYTKVMDAPPKVEPSAAAYLRAPAGNAQLPRDLRETRFDEALHLGNRVYLLDYTINCPPLTTKDQAAAEPVALSGEARKVGHYKTKVPDNIRAQI
jgi:hypothetical protein